MMQKRGQTSRERSKERVRPGADISSFIARKVSAKEVKSGEVDPDEARRQATLKKFKAAMEDQIAEDQATGEVARGFLHDARSALITEDGSLTQQFRSELRQVQDEETRLLEEKVQTARPADKDLFGIKRRECEVCADECSGYEPTKVLFGGRGEFPTFCRHCNCPAHFHKVEEEVKELPASLTDLLTGKNIQSEDLNFNCVMAAFLIKEGANKVQTSIDIARLLKEEGLEILTSHTKFMEQDEAFFLRNRIVASNEHKLAKQLSQDFQRPSFESEIRRKGEIDSLNMNKLAQNSEYLVERLSQIKEFQIQKMKTSFGTGPGKKEEDFQLGQKSRQANSLEAARSSKQSVENRNDLANSEFDPMASINQRDTQFVAKSGVVRVSVNKMDSSVNDEGLNKSESNVQDIKFNTRVGAADSGIKSSLKKQHRSLSETPFSRSGTPDRVDLDMTEVYREIERRRMLKPRKTKTQFKIRYGRRINDQRSKKLVKEVEEAYKNEFLLHALETNPLLRELCENEILLVVMNSATGQGFQSKLTTLMRQSQITEDEAVLLYSSENKVKAMEDCIQFSPELFKISKSILITEPSVSFRDTVRLQLAAEGHLASARSADSSAQSDYIKQKLRSMDSASGLHSQLSNASGSYRREGTGSSTGRYNKSKAQDSIARQMSNRGDNINTIKGLNMRQAEKHASEQTHKHIAINRQVTSTNPFRQSLSHKKTQFQNTKAVPLQKKLSVLEKVARAETIKKTQPALAHSLTKKKVTFHSNGSVIPEESAEEDPADIEQSEWVLSARNKQRAKLVAKKEQDGVSRKELNMVQFNFGVMHDFLAYSATSVQFARENVNLARPICPAGIRGGKPAFDWKYLMPHHANLFAIAKVGVANMILPNTLDIKLQNYEDFDSYLSISDFHFPNTARSQSTVLVLRPSIVKNGLNDLLLQIVKANEFLILKRQIRMLTKAEVAYLYRAEKIQKRSSKLYFEMMLQGPAEVIVVSKISAVYDCNTLFNGANPYGRRRINYTDEGKSAVIRKNVDSVDGMFEIAPFTCFSEFIDLEDFLVRNSNIQKFKKLGQGQSKLDKATFDKTAELLYSTKLAEIQTEANDLQRNFNIVGYTSRSVEDASREICIFSPQIGSIQEVCLMLNPIYNEMIDAAIEVLVRAGFTILQHEVKDLNEQQASQLFEEKYGVVDAEPIITNFSSLPIHCFHMSKIAGDRELRELFNQSDLQYEDLYFMTNWSPPLKPSQIPFLFLFMDTEKTFEMCLRLMYKTQHVEFTGQDFIDNIGGSEAANIVQGCLLVTVGDKLKKLLVDSQGNVKQQSRIEADTIDKGQPVNRPIAQEINEGQLEGCYLEPQCMLKVSKATTKSASVHFIAEADQHGVFEVRFHRLAHTGDRENSDCFPAKQIAVDRVAERGDPRDVVAEEALQFFQRFSSCSFYYNEVSKLTYNICPAFYKFKIHPFEWLFDQLKGQQSDNQDDASSLVTDLDFETGSNQGLSARSLNSDHQRKETMLQRRGSTMLGDAEYEQNQRVQQLRQQRLANKEWAKLNNASRLMRVYEVEEHMGDEFLEELSRLHQEHLNVLRHNFLTRLNISGAQGMNQEQQKSLPAYIYGLKLTEMVRELEKVKCFGKGQLRGAGKILYNRETQVLQGELPKVTQSSYFDYDRERYQKMLENFKGGWLYYLSVLETDIIEAKLGLILDSLTFKYTRQPQFLCVVPDRVTSANLRISEKIKVLNENATDDRTTKFFKPLSEDLIDPERELDVRNYVDSVLQTLNHSMLKADLDKKLREEGTSVQEILQEQASEELKKKYSIHKDCALAGIAGIARRPKHHLIASLMWLINFNFRKVDRKSDFFAGDRNRKIDSVRATIEEEYDEVLDILVKAIESNYGKDGDEVNAALDVVDLKEGGYETEFEKHMRLKNRKEEDKLRQMRDSIEAEKRKARATMSLHELIETTVHKQAEEVKRQQRKDLEKFLNFQAGTDKDGSEFMQMLENSKMHFGPYALQLAEEFFSKQMKKYEAKRNPAKVIDEQEKISFVRMEYFLYGVAEADRLIEQLKGMEIRINTLAQEAQSYSLEVESLKSDLDRYERLMLTTDREALLRKRQIQKTYENAKKRASKMDQDLTNQRYEISAKESELLMVFRELMEANLYAPDHYFDREQLIRKKENKAAEEKYIVPLETFWKPLELNEYYETNMQDKRFFNKVNPMPKADATVGQFLAKSLRDAIHRQDQAQIDKFREGGETTALRYHETQVRTEKLAFNKYESAGQRHQDRALAETKRNLDAKTSKKDFAPDVPFQFTPQ